MVTTFNTKDLMSFANYIFSEKRHERITSHNCQVERGSNVCLDDVAAWKEEKFYFENHEFSIKEEGNQWCILLGSNLQDGVSGFGNNPAEAILDFSKNYHGLSLKK